MPWRQIHVGPTVHPHDTGRQYPNGIRSGTTSAVRPKNAGAASTCPRCRPSPSSSPHPDPQCPDGPHPASCDYHRLPGIRLL